MNAHDEVSRGRRFAFGRNWTSYARGIDEARIAAAETSLETMLGRASLAGLSFLDVGCGSGLFSLAARRLGAEVRSFDFDPDSVSCTRELRQRFRPDDPGWQVEQGSILDPRLVESLGRHDIVYSWGVLHHTGDMWQAIGNVCQLVAPDGLLFIAIYNRQVYWSRLHRGYKQAYNRSPLPGKWLIAGGFISIQVLKGLLKDVALLRNPLARYQPEYRGRGMSRWHDWIDWVGGYPFEVASPEEVFDFCRQRGFELRRLKTCGGGYGCNEFVFERSTASLSHAERVRPESPA